MELMFELNREAGTTLVLVTHDRAIADRCDRQLHIEAGRPGGDGNRLSAEARCRQQPTQATPHGCLSAAEAGVNCVNL